MEAQSFVALGSALMHDAQTAVIFADAEGLVRFWNDGAEALFGHSPADALGKSLEMIIPEGLRGAHRTCFGQAMRSSWAASVEWGALEALHAGGAFVDVEVFLTPVGRAGEASHGALAFFRRLRVAASP